MLLNELATSSDAKIRKINKVLKETFGFTLVSEVAPGKLNTLYTKIADDLYNLKLDLGSVKSPDYMQKVLVLEGLKLLIEKNRLHEGLRTGPGANAYEKVNNWLTQFVNNACEVGDDYEDAIREAMKQYRSSKYRFEDMEVEHDLRKVTAHCSDERELSVMEGKECDKCDCNPCECDKVEEECSKIEEYGLHRHGSVGTTPSHELDTTTPEQHAKFMKNMSKRCKKVKPPMKKRARRPKESIEEGGDRHAEHDWVKTMKKDAGIDSGPGYYDSDSDGLSLEDPEEIQQDDADDFFSYRSKQKRTKMKEGYIKNLRRLLEAETDQAESLIAAKSFSQELQDMVEKLGRLVNENLPAVSEQMRDAYGSDVATGFEDQVAGTLNSVMDSLRNSKQEIDNSVSTIADGGAPMAGNDMEDYSDEELGGEFDADSELDLDGDIDLDMEVGDELGDEFGGDDAMAGDVDEPLGRAKKESLKIIGRKLVETKAKLARIKAKQ